MIPLYIFDLDGTLAEISHRRHFVEGLKKDWKAFYAACVNDAPNWPVISVFRALRSTGARLWIWSGRSDEVQEQTERWLHRHQLDFDAILMRPQGDYTPDDKLKRQWYEWMADEDRQALTAVFDDRTRMVRMWRDLGVPCFQVADGDF